MTKKKAVRRNDENFEYDMRDLKWKALSANERLWHMSPNLGTFGNASVLDRKHGILAIKPSGIHFGQMVAPSVMVLVSLATGECFCEQDLKPSVDLPTHLEIYRAWSMVTSIAHTHSKFATVYAQAFPSNELPCMGTTHADYFCGEVPITYYPKEHEVEKDYEKNVGRVIIDRFRADKKSALDVPGVLVGGHGPFTWGQSWEDATENMAMLEAAAELAFLTETLNAGEASLPAYLIDKHYYRKHGKSAYYGQGRKS